MYIITYYTKSLCSSSTQIGVEDVEEELSKVPSLSPVEFKTLMDTGKYTVIDTRKVSSASCVVMDTGKIYTVINTRKVNNASCVVMET